MLLAGKSNDSEIQSLRHTLQSTEKGGNVDWPLGGHVCERLAEVQQGRSEDGFQSSADESNPLLWRPNSIAVKNLRFTRSHLCVLHLGPLSSVIEFEFGVGFDCIGLLLMIFTLSKKLFKVWRVRYYESERCVAAAKPLWFLPAVLSLTKDEVKRIM